MPDVFSHLIDQLNLIAVFWAVIFGIVTIIVARFAKRATSKLLHHDSNPLPSSSIIINIVRAAIYIVGGSFILNTCFGIDVSAIITALGVGGIAVSLGFQDTLSNLIGGLQVTFMGIVKPGDNIEVGSQRGVVQDVTWRHTTIRDSVGQVVIIPNSVISTTSLVHLLPASRVSVPFAVSRLVDTDGIDALATAGGGQGASAAGGQNTPAAPRQEPRDIDQLTSSLIDKAQRAASAISPITDGPKVFFSEISELGIKGKIIFTIEDASQTAVAADAVVRAIAREL